jgi:hypothetical protein
MDKEELNKEEKYLSRTLDLLNSVVIAEEAECIDSEQQFNIENEKYLLSTQ